MILGRQWQKESDDVKKTYKAKAELVKAQHNLDNPGYIYQPRNPAQMKRRLTKRKATALAQADAPGGTVADVRVSTTPPEQLEATSPQNLDICSTDTMVTDCVAEWLGNYQARQLAAGCIPVPTVSDDGETISYDMTPFDAQTLAVETMADHYNSAFPPTRFVNPSNITTSSQDITSNQYARDNSSNAHEDLAEALKAYQPDMPFTNDAMCSSDLHSDFALADTSDMNDWSYNMAEETRHSAFTSDPFLFTCEDLEDWTTG